MTVQDKRMTTSEQGITCSSDIAIHVKNGTAVITGVACSNEVVVQAEKAVDAMVGIEHVFNLLTTD